MWFLVLPLLHAHEHPVQEKMMYSLSLGYQYRTLVEEEDFSSPHCSVIQYGATFYVSDNPFLNAFLEPNVAVVGLNQSIVQPNASLILGFQLGSFFTIGSGPIVSARNDDDNPFFPQMMLQTSVLLHVDNTVLPLKFAYVPASQSLEQYQLTLSYTFPGRGKSKKK